MSRSARSDGPPGVTPSTCAAQSALTRGGEGRVGEVATQSTLVSECSGGAAESQRLALAVLGSAPVHGGAVAGEDRGPLGCRREVRDAADTSRALSHIDVHERAAERTPDFFDFLEAHHSLVPRFRVRRRLRPLVLPRRSSISPMVRSRLVASRSGR
jgi:hypothetical protein